MLLVDDLLAALPVRTGRWNCARVDLLALASDAARRAGDGPQTTLEGPWPKLEVLGDESPAGAARNLVANAIQHTGKHNAVRVGTENDDAITGGRQ